MGCKQSNQRGEDGNRFDGMRRHQRSMSKSPQDHTSLPSKRRATDDKEAENENDVICRRYEVTEVPLTHARFESLPASTIRRSVYRVYDGDTITLRGKDSDKVRLLAMDTPEVQDHEPYALEARDFVARLVQKKTIYLAFDGQEKDRYGRYLALVYVKDASVPPFKYLCVNVAVVEAGLANYYHPQKDPLVLDQVFLDAQKSARRARLHLWATTCEDFEVFLTPHGKAFHCKECTSVQNVPLTAMSMGAALDMGHYACRDCHPNWQSAATATTKGSADEAVNRSEHNPHAAIVQAAAPVKPSSEEAANHP